MTLTDEQLHDLSGHTPGPWEFGPGHSLCISPKDSIKEIANISRPDMGGCMGLIEWPTNAALIAAAPDLLHEVREARAEVKRLKGTEAALRMMVEGYSKRIEEVTQ